MEFKEFDFGGGKCLNSCTLRGHQNVHENASLEETVDFKVLLSKCTYLLIPFSINFLSVLNLAIFC